jgi:hypothetical protein
MPIPKSIQNKILNNIGIMITNRAKEMCPLDMGELRKSIDYEIRNGKVVIFSDCSYSQDMEYGKPPTPLTETDRKDLSGWSKRHNANPIKIEKYIEKHGIKVGTEEDPLHITSYGRDSYRPFIRPAIHQMLPQIKLRLKLVRAKYA